MKDISMKHTRNVQNSEHSNNNNNSIIAEYTKRAQNSLNQFLKLNQQQIDKIVKAMSLAGLSHQLDLAKMACEETGRGVVEDKVVKNIFATEYIYNSIKDEKTVGIIENNFEQEYMKIAEPVGILAGIIPVTNPTSTTMFKAIIAIKARNPIIFSFHPAAQKCSSMAAKFLRDAAVAAGAPENCIQWLENADLSLTHTLINYPAVSLVLATGGSGMVKAAYSTGKPALGVGPGNVPCYIHQSANVEQAIHDLIMSKSFDNGMICASEQAAIIDESIYENAIHLLKSLGCYFPSTDEIKKLNEYMIRADGGVNPDVVGKPACEIAQAVDISVPQNTKILCCEIEDAGPNYPLSREKLSPVLAIIKTKNVDDGIRIAVEMIKLRGMGHTAVIHAHDQDIIQKYSLAVQVGRVILNSPSSQGAIGDLYNSLMPSLTLGCGTYGHNATTENVTTHHLLNIKRVAKRQANLQWFKIPEKIYFEPNSIAYLEKMSDVSRVMIVSDKTMVNLGYTDRIIEHLERRTHKVHYEIFSDIEPDPSLTTILTGAKAMTSFAPDTIVALGGGSPIDAAKIMWLYFEYPETDFEKMSLKFLDIRKRTYQFPKLGKRAKFVAIPTTSGTGAEVTPFAVVKDEQNQIKYPLADYELTPDVAIIDPTLVMSMPQSTIAYTGLDALSHAIESFVSVLASDYTDALSLRAARLIFTYLPLSYHEKNNQNARTKMHNAACIAGLSFSNAFLGINHSLAHQLGAQFNIPHGLANSILLPHVIMYNGQENPTKFNPFPNYDHYIAPQKYAELAEYVGLKFKSQKDAVKELAKSVHSLSKKLTMPLSIKEFGIDEALFLSKLSSLAENAFNDQCTTANPRLPLISELKEILTNAYYGFEINVTNQSKVK